MDLFGELLLYVGSRSIDLGRDCPLPWSIHPNCLADFDVLKRSALVCHYRRRCLGHSTDARFNRPSLWQLRSVYPSPSSSNLVHAALRLLCDLQALQGLRGELEDTSLHSCVGHTIGPEQRRSGGTARTLMAIWFRLIRQERAHQCCTYICLAGNRGK